jgi:hypothetical protein
MILQYFIFIGRGVWGMFEGFLVEMTSEDSQSGISSTRRLHFYSLEKVILTK